jgi:hypothetical protein
MSSAIEALGMSLQFVNSVKPREKNKNVLMLEKQLEYY